MGRAWELNNSRLMLGSISALSRVWSASLPEQRVVIESCIQIYFVEKLSLCISSLSCMVRLTHSFSVVNVFLFFYTELLLLE